MKKFYLIGALLLSASSTAFAADPATVTSVAAACCDLLLDCCAKALDCCP